MKCAYDILGIPTYHGFVEYVERPEHQIIWEKAVDAKLSGKRKPVSREDFDDFLGDWGGIADFPALSFTDELIEAYPEVRLNILFSKRID